MVKRKQVRNQGPGKFAVKNIDEKGKEIKTDFLPGKTLSLPEAVAKKLMKTYPRQVLAPEDMGFNVVDARHFEKEKTDLEKQRKMLEKKAAELEKKEKEIEEKNKKAAAKKKAEAAELEKR